LIYLLLTGPTRRDRRWKRRVNLRLPMRQSRRPDRLHLHDVCAISHCAKHRHWRCFGNASSADSQSRELRLFAHSVSYILFMKIN